MIIFFTGTSLVLQLEVKIKIVERKRQDETPSPQAWKGIIISLCFLIIFYIGIFSTNKYLSKPKKLIGIHRYSKSFLYQV